LLQIQGLWLRVNELSELHDLISRWIRLPLEQLAVSELLGEFELARLPDQTLTLRFGPRDDTISPRNPVVTVKVRAGTLSAELHFATDQSCLALFAQELSNALYEGAA
jgi:hypothetical protein